jgi:cytosine/adenosine deaminase-related metal-dependent hydrolase
MCTPWTLTARWVLPVEGPPLEGGTVTIRDDRILAVEPRGGWGADVDLGNVALVPGLVNAHTHLDLSGLRGRVRPAADFTAWLRAVVGHRRGLGREQVEADTRAGLAEGLSSGTTLVGDISAQGWSWPVLAAAPVRAVVFFELLGLPRGRARQAWSAARAWLADHPGTPTCRPGLSPHAPYSVRTSLLRKAARRARERRLPLAIHLAETRDEAELLEHRGGPLAAFLEELGAWDPGGLPAGTDQVLHLAGGLPVVLAHGNYLDASAPLPRGATVVYCPRTHAAFGHPVHPCLRGGLGEVRVALGTDSLASNPDLDMLGEARFVHQRHPEVGGDRLLRMATLSGAEALGWGEETGSLRAGKSADLVAVGLPSEDNSEPYSLIFGSSLPVQKVLFRGRWVYDQSSPREAGDTDSPVS